jgi:uncharacterized protein YdhG (YjbR/CyaY superfamily)
VLFQHEQGFSRQTFEGFEIGQRQILNDLREMIATELPNATEVIKYGIPTFMIEGVAIIGFDGYKKHNSVFPYSGSTNMLLEKELAGYEQTKGSIHFAVDKRFPKPLLRRFSRRASARSMQAIQSAQVSI